MAIQTFQDTKQDLPDKILPEDYGEVSENKWKKLPRDHIYSRLLDSMALL